MFDSYVALGDSFTEGLEDTRPDGTHRGWADRLADHLAAQVDLFRYANLGVRGRKLRGIVAEQVPVAESLQPSLISIGAGGNDILRWSSDLDALGEIFDGALARLSATGATVLTFAGFDPRKRIPFTSVPGRRADAYNAHIRRSAARHGALLVDLWDMPRIYEDRMWAPDRLHLSSDGHALVAAAVLTTLGQPTSFTDLVTAPEPPARSGMSRAVEDARWFAVDVLPWAYRGIRGRSSGDGRAPKYAEYITWPG